MAVQVEKEHVEVQETEEMVDGKRCIRRRTIRTHIEEEIIDTPPAATPEPAPEAVVESVEEAAPESAVEEEATPEPEPEAAPEPEEPTPEAPEEETVEAVAEEAAEETPEEPAPESPAEETADVPEEVAAEPAAEVTPEAAPEEPASTPDLLSCQCVTPSGVLINGLALANPDGTFTFDVNASESGVHKVVVELDGKPIPGSPFLVRIIQSANKEEIRLSGDGLESGVVDGEARSFYIDTKGAGPGDLKVRMQGPKGGFAVSLSREPTNDRLVKVTYTATSAGIYTIHAFWCGDHVPGSPCELLLSLKAAD